MRKATWAAVLALGLGLALLAEVPSGPTSVRLSWDMPQDWEYDTNVVYRLHSSTNAAAPVAEWPIAATVTNATNVVLMVSPGRCFYYCTASNFWGESGPSNVVLTPPVPDPGRLKIQKP